MVVVESRKVVKITAMPEDKDNPNDKLSDYMRKELKRRQEV